MSDAPAAAAGGAGRGWRSGASLQRAGAAALALGSGGFLVLRCAFSPCVPLIVQGGSAPWITDPRPVVAEVQQWGRDEAPLATFARRFDVAAPPARAELRVRALRRFRVWVNGNPVSPLEPASASWRSVKRTDVAPLLREGNNELRVAVSNLRGPPLLSARLELPGGALATDASWTVSVDGGAAQPAMLADDTRPHPSAAAVRSPLAIAAAKPQPLLIVAVVSLALALALYGRMSPALERRLPLLALVAAHGAWLWLFVARIVEIPLWTGFDATNHLAYVEHLRTQRALPLPTDGWSTYHPPLFYAAAALVSELARGGAVALHLLPFACGLGGIWVAFGLARLLLPGRPAPVAIAVLFATVLPLNVYMAAYVSNEPLHALLFGLAGLWTVRALLAGRARRRDVVVTGTVLGLALLTKFTALVALAVVAFFLCCHVWLVERGSATRVAGRLALLLLPAAGLSGWFYLRNVLRYGRALVGNWDLPEPGLAWWSQPGFHTPAYYLGFGEVFRHPFFSGFRSFGDALYSSFWGDGWLAGRAAVTARHAFWNYDFMAVGYLLALPATALLAVGLVRMLVEAFRDGDPRRRAAWSFVLTLVYALGFALLSISLELPYFGQGRAPYALGLLGPLSVAFALGAATCDAWLARRRWNALRVVGGGWLAMLALVLFLGFAG